MKHRIVIALLLSLLLPKSALTQTPQVSPTSLQAAQEKKRVGSKDDITAIGHRKIGNKGVGNWYSLERELKVGKEYAEDIESEVALLKDPVINEYINRVGQNLVRHSDAQIPFSIKVIDSDEVNALSLPGGFLYVNTGLILACDNEAELAGVMAHEIAHVAARHGTRQMTRETMFRLAELPLAFVGGGVVVTAIQVASKIAEPLSILRFSRAFEAEADYLGLEYMYVAGYDPQSFITFLEREGAGGTKTGALKGLFYNHPPTASRVRKGQKEIERVLEVRDSYLVNTSEFDLVKSHLQGMTSLNGAHGTAEAPTLRRRTVPSN
jgi:predicted Zn-dependent protease